MTKIRDKGPCHDHTLLSWSQCNLFKNSPASTALSGPVAPIALARSLFVDSYVLQDHLLLNHSVGFSPSSTLWWFVSPTHLPTGVKWIPLQSTGIHMPIAPSLKPPVGFWCCSSELSYALYYLMVINWLWRSAIIPLSNLGQCLTITSPRSLWHFLQLLTNCHIWRLDVWFTLHHPRPVLLFWTRPGRPNNPPECAFYGASRSCWT